jgi:superfamily I DNA/RNA helicase
LRPPNHIASQGISINYDKKQTRLINSAPGFQKIKGVAGCGKTTILAKRAVNAHKRHYDKVLILTYNKTLRNFIRDKISEVRKDFSWGCFGITNYHSFITQMLNESGIEITSPQNYTEVSAYFDELYSNESLFDKHIDELYKYKTILIDEVQDYRPEWIKIIRKYFLSDDGEMILFGDDSQNIYERDVNKNNSAIAQGFGRWERLTKSYRSKIDSPLTSMSKLFQSKYLVSKYDIDLFDVEPTQFTLFFDLMKGIEFSDIGEIDNIYKMIFKYLKNDKIHPNDVTIISTNINFLRKLDQIIRIVGNEKTQTTFESEEVYLDLAKRYERNGSELKRELENIRGSKKFSFNLNSGLIKLSTVHSFKGLESSTSIYILLKEDVDEMVYTGITRAKQNSIIFIQNTSKYLDFFQTEPDLKFDKMDLIDIIR